MTLDHDLYHVSVELAGSTSPVPPSEPTRVKRLTGGGSRRMFYRFGYRSQSVVVLIQPEGGPEFERYVRVGNFLRDHRAGTPEFYGMDRGRGILVMEDLGDIHLQDALAGCTRRERIRLYHECIRILVKFQTTITTAMMNSGLLKKYPFDFSKLMDETEYFRREFMENLCHMEPEPGWEEERNKLAKALSQITPVFMHRDFQSKNIMLKEGRIRIIDFQTAHRGPGIYDAAALLKDPYYPLPPDEVEEILKRLHSVLSKAGIPCDDFRSYQQLLTWAGIQRNLQALAAFAKLGYREDQREFLRYIPAGLKLLRRGIGEAGNFPVLERMAEKIELYLQSSGFYSWITL